MHSVIHSEIQQYFVCMHWEHSEVLDLSSTFWNPIRVQESQIHKQNSSIKFFSLYPNWGKESMVSFIWAGCWKNQDKFHKGDDTAEAFKSE